MKPRYQRIRPTRAERNQAIIHDAHIALRALIVSVLLLGFIGLVGYRLIKDQRPTVHYNK